MSSSLSSAGTYQTRSGQKGIDGASLPTKLIARGEKSLTNQLEMLKTAGRIASETVRYVGSQLSASNSPVAELCLLGDRFAKNQLDKVYTSVCRGLSFPTCVSPNSIVSNFAPLLAASPYAGSAMSADRKIIPHAKMSIGDRLTTIHAGDLVKIEIGVQIDGRSVHTTQSFLVPSAFKMSSSPAADGSSDDDADNFKRANVITAAHLAIGCLLKQLKPPATPTAVPKGTEDGESIDAWMLGMQAVAKESPDDWEKLAVIDGITGTGVLAALDDHLKSQATPASERKVYASAAYGNLPVKPVVGKARRAAKSKKTRGSKDGKMNGTTTLGFGMLKSDIEEWTEAVAKEYGCSIVYDVQMSRAKRWGGFYDLPYDQCVGSMDGPLDVSDSRIIPGITDEDADGLAGADHCDDETKGGLAKGEIPVWELSVTLAAGPGDKDNFIDLKEHVHFKPTVFRKEPEKHHELKRAYSRRVLALVNRTVQGDFAFAAGSVMDTGSDKVSKTSSALSEAEFKTGLKECVDSELFTSYKVLATKDGSPVAKYRVSVAMTNDGPVCLTPLLPIASSVTALTSVKKKKIDHPEIRRAVSMGLGLATGKSGKKRHNKTKPVASVEKPFPPLGISELLDEDEFTPEAISTSLGMMGKELKEDKWQVIPVLQGVAGSDNELTEAERKKLHETLIADKRVPVDMADVTPAGLPKVGETLVAGSVVPGKVKGLIKSWNQMPQLSK
jgi:methionine aminopeptidase